MKVLILNLPLMTFVFLAWGAVPAQSPDTAQKTLPSATFTQQLSIQVIEQKTGTNVTGLKAEDFTVLFGTEAQKVRTLERKENSLDLLFLVSPKDEGAIVILPSQSRYQLSDALLSLPGSDRVGVIQILQGGIQKLLSFEDPKSIPVLDEGPYQLIKPYSYEEGIKESLSYLKKKAGTNRQILVVLANHKPNLSDTNIRDIYEQVLRSKITVYWFYCPDSLGWAFRKPIYRDWKNFRFDKFKAEILTALSGGEMLTSNKDCSGYKEITEQMVKNLRSTYELSFQPPASLATDTPQLIEVKLAPHLKHKEKEWRVITPRAVIVPKPQEKK